MFASHGVYGIASRIQFDENYRTFSDSKDVTGINDFPKGGDLFDLCEMLDSKTNEEIAEMINSMIMKSAPEVEIVDDEMNSVYPWHPFPVDILPETASRFIHEVAAANCCDPAGPAIATLITLATAIGNSRRLRLKRGWVFPAILWGMLIARKGSTKSWAMAPAIKPLHLKQEEYHLQYDREKDEYERQRAEYAKLTPSAGTGLRSQGSDPATYPVPRRDGAEARQKHGRESSGLLRFL